MKISFNNINYILESLVPQSGLQAQKNNIIY